MSAVLLDTNVLSELMKKRPAPEVLARLREHRPDELSTSSICAMELRFGAQRHAQGQRLWRRIERDILARIRVLPVGVDEARRAGDLLADLEARGLPIGVEDVLIGATALAAGLTVVTRNSKHFSRIPGLALESWWE